MINPFIVVINSLLPEPHASLLNGALFGIKASMPRNLYDALVTTGTLHIIALSGMNISILVTLIAGATLYLGRKISILITLASIWLFVAFVGFSPSVVRAAGMGSMSLFAIYFGRQSISLFSLFIISIIMLFIDIKLLTNISFQLSFLATFGIIIASKKMKFQEKSGIVQNSIRIVKENFRLTLFAQLFTLPVILFNFRRLSLIAPLTNVLIEWSIQPIMVLGFVTGIAGWIWRPLGIIPAWITWVPLSYLVAVVEWLAKVPMASVQF